MQEYIKKKSMSMLFVTIGYNLVTKLHNSHIYHNAHKLRDLHNYLTGIDIENA